MNKKAILIVDDVELNRCILNKILENDFKIFEAENGLKAMKIIESNNIDIVITDIFMEPMNGYELIRNIRSCPQYKKIPVIAITESDRASRKKALQSGADDLIYRPFVNSILQNRIKGLLLDGTDINRYKSAYDNNPVPFVLYRVIDRPDTPNYKIVYLNRAAQAIVEPPVGVDFMRTDEFPEHRDLILTALRTGDAQQEIIFSRDIKKYLDITVYSEGNGLLAAMIHDITEQVETQTAEARTAADEAIKEKNQLSEILEKIPAGILVFKFQNGNLRLAGSNTSGRRIMQIDEKRAINADRELVFSLVHKDDVSAVNAAADKLSVPDTSLSFEFRYYIRSQSKYVWISSSGCSELMPDGSTCVFVSYTDITSQKQLAETELKLVSAQKANEAKTEFLSRMSHDMRTPLSGILGLAELMRDKTDLDEIRADIDQIQLSGHYLLNLINDTLDISRIETGKLELHEKPVNSFEILQNVLSDAQMMASNKGVQLKVIIPPIPKNGWVEVVADSSRLEQILINVISNAIKYTPENGTVELDMKTVDITCDEVVDRYIIRDNGIGINKDFLPHVFDRFTQEGRLNSERQNGTGLGLMIVKQLVDLMGGKIKIESEENVGTTVTIEMHYKVYHGKAEPEMINKPIDYIKDKRILLCEDHPLNAKIATKLLERVGAKIDLASDGSIGLNMFESAEDGYYDAILMDIRMPVMNGLEATSAIRKSGKKHALTIPIIAMTANAFSSDVKTCFESGMNAHVAKPIEPKKLYETLAEQMMKFAGN